MEIRSERERYESGVLPRDLPEGFIQRLGSYASGEVAPTTDGSGSPQTLDET